MIRTSKLGGLLLAAALALPHPRAQAAGGPKWVQKISGYWKTRQKNAQRPMTLAADHERTLEPLHGRIASPLPLRSKLRDVDTFGALLEHAPRKVASSSKLGIALSDAMAVFGDMPEPRHRFTKHSLAEDQALHAEVFEEALAFARLKGQLKHLKLDESLRTRLVSTEQHVQGRLDAALRRENELTIDEVKEQLGAYAHSTNLMAAMRGNALGPAELEKALAERDALLPIMDRTRAAFAWRDANREALKGIAGDDPAFSLGYRTWFEAQDARVRAAFTPAQEAMARRSAQDVAAAAAKVQVRNAAPAVELAPAWTPPAPGSARAWLHDDVGRLETSLHGLRELAKRALALKGRAANDAELEKLQYDFHANRTRLVSEIQAIRGGLADRAARATAAPDADGLVAAELAHLDTEAARIETDLALLAGP